MADAEVGLFKFQSPGGLQNDLIGNVLSLGTNGTTLTPERLVHHVTGTAATLTTIVPPWVDFTGPLYLVADSVFTGTLGGNLSVIFTTVAGNAYGFIYDRKAGKWYPTR